MHGALLDYESLQKGVQSNQYLYGSLRYGRPDAIPPYEGYKAFLALEGSADVPGDLVEAAELAGLLTTQQVPVVVLNACQSSMQVGERETSLASRLMAAGVQLAVGMSYSVTVDAAKLLMTTLYSELFTHAEQDFTAALRHARLELHNTKQRRGYRNMTVDLEDRPLPVAYQNQPVKVQTRPFEGDEEPAYLARKARAFAFPEPLYGFFGRDLDVLEIEKRLLAAGTGQPRNVLLLRGMGRGGQNHPAVPPCRMVADHALH